jgi:hypothetical protein
MHEPTSGAVLPRTIDVQWPTAQMSFHLDIANWLVNTIPADNYTLWTKPEYQGYPNVDLADPNLRFAVPGSAQPPAAVLPPNAALQYPPGATIPLR